MTLGMIVAAPGGRPGFRYAFTPADVVWLGRLLAVASSGPYRSRVRAILWRALARFASSQRPGLSLAAFIQHLEPSLPRVPWGQLPPDARQLALAAGRGQLRRRHPNAPVQVMPRGGFAPAGYGYRARSPYGWRGESELMETAPPGDAQSPAPPPPPPPVGAAPPPSDDASDPDAGPGPSDDVPADDGGMEPPPMADEPMPPPASFDTADGNRLNLNPKWMRALLRSRRRRPGWWRGSPGSGYPGAPGWRAGYPYAGSPYTRPPYGGYQPWRSFVRPTAGAARTLVGRLGRLARNARRVGTLRAVRSGRRYPVFGGQVAGRNYRIITRPRGGVRHEIMAVRGSELQQEFAR